MGEQCVDPLSMRSEICGRNKKNDVWIYGYMDTQKMDVWIYGHMDTHTHTHTHIYIYIYIHIYIYIYIHIYIYPMGEQLVDSFSVRSEICK